MKSTRPDSLAEAWASLAGLEQHAAIFDTNGFVLRTFGQIEEEARGFEETLLREFGPGEVVAIQLGNHAAWPALLLACLRRQLVALPLERTLAEREREAALSVCQASALAEIMNEQIALKRLSREPIAWGPNPPSLLKLTSGTTAAPRAIRFRSEQLLADCNQIC